MKRLILLVMMLTAFVAGNSFAQTARKVLVEEFTSSTCPPCAATDPLMQQFQSAYGDKIVVLKWHVNWPAPGNDPMYTIFPGSVNRSTVYYNNPYAPQIFMDGTTDFGFTGGPADVPAMETDVDNAAAISAPFTIDISQQIVGDSMIVNLIVKSTSDLPTETDLRLGVVVGERYLKFQGTNGLPAHDYVVRTTIPGLVSATGAVGTSTAYPAFTITKGGTNNYRYAAKIGATWDRSQLFSAAFIQSVAKKTVYQANWTIPNITASTTGITDVVMTPATGTMQVTLTNHTATTQNVGVSYVPAYNTTGWSVAFTGISGTTLALNAGESKSVNLALTSPTPAVGSSIGDIIYTTSDGMRLGGQTVTFFGSDNTDVVVDAGAGTDGAGKLLDNSLTPGGLKAGLIGRDQFMTAFNDWSLFKTVVVDAGADVGIQVGNLEWQNLSDHLYAGGNVLFTGTTTISDYASSGSDEYMQYWRDNFHIDPSAAVTSTWSKLTGVTGDPISNGISATLSPKNSYRQDLSSYDDQFNSIFTNEKNDVVGMKALSNGGKVVFLSFELESLAAADQSNISKKIIDWFNAVASVKTSNEASEVKISNYPNPVTKSTKFDYSVTERGLVNLALYDVMGRQITSLVSDEMQDQGTYTADFDASHLSNGSYTYVLTTGSKKVVGTMTVTK